MRITSKGQVTIPPAMRKKHGLWTDCLVKLVDRPDGVLVTKSRPSAHGKRVLASMLRGGKIKGRTEDWLRMTRGDT